jgi:hypothetical protein
MCAGAVTAQMGHIVERYELSMSGGRQTAASISPSLAVGAASLPVLAAVGVAERPGRRRCAWRVPTPDDLGVCPGHRLFSGIFGTVLH